MSLMQLGSEERSEPGRTGVTVSTERAFLAGGCFWGVQDLLRRYPGVISTRVGYTGWEVPNATYRNHGNHAEGVEISSIRRSSVIASCWNSFSRSTTPRP
jgi:peptide methionine sulfoxide reductase MsrA